MTMNWKGKRVLVTGAGGFIGSHLTEKLVTLGAHTRALVHYRADNSWGWLNESPYQDQIEVIAGDVCDHDSVAAALHGMEIVFHVAALIAIPYSYQAPFSYVRTNIEGTVNVLQAARASGVELLVHTSTSEVYGSARYTPMDEEHPLQAQSPYSASKIAADKMAEAFYSSFGLPVATIRPFNTYGPRQSARAVIPSIVTQALTQSEVSLGNLEPTRDFNYVDDTVDAFIRMGECSGAVGQVINIGSGREISIGDLATLILELVGRREIPVTCDDKRLRFSSSEVQRLCADNREAHDTLGWCPSNTLEQGLVSTIEWIRNNISSYQLGTYAI